MTTLELYRSLEAELLRVRLKNNDQESKEEDEILDSMDSVWYNLDEDEQEILGKEGSHSAVCDLEKLHVDDISH